MLADILIVSNGPGELAAWVRPMIRQLRQDLPDARLTLALVPCPYASGHEAETARSWGEDLEVWTPRETISRLFSKQLSYESGAILFMGGDQFFGRWLSRKTRLPLYTYTEGFARWVRSTRRFLLKDSTTYEALRDRGMPATKCEVVGDLMVDAALSAQSERNLREEWDMGDRPVVSLLPGSKPFKLRYITPMWLRAAELVRESVPETQFILHRSPFTTYEALEEVLNDPRFREVTQGIGGTLIRDEDGAWIVTEGGLRIRVADPELQYDAMAIADVALAVPGTNTAELAILGVPMVVALPLNKPEVIPLDGLIGRIGDIPLLGAALKRTLIPRMARRFPWVSLPNQKAKQMLVPELVGVLSPHDVANAAISLLCSPERRRRVSQQLKEVMGPPGAAKAIVEVLERDL